MAKRCLKTVVIVIISLVMSSIVFAAKEQQPGKEKLERMFKGAIATAEKASKHVSEGSMRLSEVCIGSLERDVKVIGKNLPFEKIYDSLAEAEKFIDQKMAAAARKALDTALADANKITGVNKEIINELKKNIADAKDSLNKGTLEIAGKSISAANEVMDRTGMHTNYKKVQSHLAKAKAAVIDGSIETAKNELALSMESLNGLWNNVEAYRIRANIENAAVFIKRNAFIPARKELDEAVKGISEISSRVGEAGRGVLDKAIAELKKISSELGKGTVKTKDNIDNVLSEILANIEEFLEY